MILADANILLYAYNDDAPECERARSWIEEQLSAPDLFCFAWQTITAFIRISTNARAFPRPFSTNEATEIVSEWLTRPQSIVLVPGDRHWGIFNKLLRDGQAIGPLVMDAHLAALSIEYGCTLATTDRDFARFPGLRFVNPIAEN